ncbi:MAG: hypothetical protein FWH57_08935 [Oscillospiraceae bacterium]|nr:hypothetical protein [Oscillospiraceae bacterium]
MCYRRSVERQGDNSPEAADIPVAGIAAGAVDIAAAVADIGAAVGTAAAVVGIAAEALVDTVAVAAAVAVDTVAALADTGVAVVVAGTAVVAATPGRLQVVARKPDRIEDRLELVSHNYCNLPWFVLLSLSTALGRRL